LHISSDPAHCGIVASASSTHVAGAPALVQRSGGRSGGGIGTVSVDGSGR